MRPLDDTDRNGRKTAIAYEYIKEETAVVAKDLNKEELQRLIDYRFGKFLRILYVETNAKS